jgi:glycosyltransferase involved in cell wall biosynthesis
LRILFINPVGFLGGAERVLLDVIASLKPVLPDGSSMQLICLADGPLVAEAQALGIDARALPLPQRITNLGESGLAGGKLAKAGKLAINLAVGSPAAIQFVSRFRRVVLDGQPDLIHSNGVKSHLLTRLLPRRAGKVVWHIHDLLGGRALLSNVLKHAAGHVSGAIAISQAVANDLKAVLPATPVYTVLNGTDIEHFSPADVDGSLLDSLAGVDTAPPQTVRVGLVATYARWKGQDVYLDAIARLAADSAVHLPPVRFYIIGGSIYHTSGSQFTREELQARAAALGIADRVAFVGFQRDPQPIYRALDIMVHASSKPEPFGKTIIEAMACQKPVIISASGGAVELFTDGIDGLGVQSGSVPELAAAMSRLIADPQLRRDIGLAARQSAVQRFGRDRIGAEFLKVYQQVLNRPN